MRRAGAHWLRWLRWPLGLSLLLSAAAWVLPARSAEPELPSTLTLDAALDIARRHQPDLRQAHANTEAAEARVDQARAGLLPQVSASASYARSTNNVAPTVQTYTGGGGIGGGNPGRSSFDTVNSFRSSLSASQLLWDFGQTTGRRDQARANADVQARNEKTAALIADLNVRAAFYTASTARGAVDAAKETLANQNRHLEQIQAFVDLGRSPPIDLLQAKVDQANAEVQLINAQNDYATARAVLNQTMGVESSIHYEVQQTISAPVEGESSSLSTLVELAIAARPEIAALRDQQRAQELANRANRARYLPSLGLQANGSYNGLELDRLVWNLSAAVNLSWLIYDGGNVRGILREGAANLAALAAQIDSIRLQIRVEVEQAQLAVSAAKAALGASDRSLSNARARLDLAEVRYRTGVGNGIELSDAQLAATNAAFQKLQAQLRLDTARAQLTKALART
ncbi:MAG TPA: TolC family protein [Polyangia bacterium]|nr:TolC family protein [Polyangia bacterium]